VEEGRFIDVLILIWHLFTTYSKHLADSLDG